MSDCPECDKTHARGAENCPARRIGTTVAGKFRIEKLLGVGGMGAVYAALHTDLGEHVALKMLLGDAARSPMVVERFRQEARESREIRHPNVVSVRDFGRDADGAPYLEMEMLQGSSFEDLVTDRPLSPARAAELVAQALDGLAAAHARSTVHRDLKPANLFLHHGRDGREVVKVLDFGIAKVASELKLTGDQSLLGTPLFMSPEQSRGAKGVDARTDLYSMGAVLFYLLTQQPVVAGETLYDILLKLGEGQIDRDLRKHRPDAPEALAAVVERALRQLPAERFQSAEEMKSALLASVAGAPAPPPPAKITERIESTDQGPRTVAATPPLDRTVAAPAPPAPPFVTPAPRWPWAVGAAALALVGLVAAKVLSSDHAATDAPTPAARDAATVAPPPSAPPGMSAFAAQTFVMGTAPEAVDALLAACAADGCRRESLMREVPSQTRQIAAFALDAREVTAGDFGRWVQGVGARAEPRTIEVVGAPQTLSYAVLGAEPLAVVDVDAGALVMRGAEVVVRAGREALPMTLVTWFGARRYCQSRGARLPTEAEWELAARGPSRREHPWGEGAPECSGVVFARLASGRCNALGAGPLAPGSASQDRTPDGVFDLGGNVAEWVEDPFAPGDERGVRGGSFAEPAHLTRGAARGHMSPALGRLQVGFRCAR